MDDPADGLDALERRLEQRRRQQAPPPGRGRLTPPPRRPAVVKSGPAPAPVPPGDGDDQVAGAVQVHGFAAEVRRGGERTVFYLPRDVIDELHELRAAADELGVRLSMSSIITQLVRRYRAERRAKQTPAETPPS